MLDHRVSRRWRSTNCRGGQANPFADASTVQPRCGQVAGNTSALRPRRMIQTDLKELNRAHPESCWITISRLVGVASGISFNGPMSVQFRDDTALRVGAETKRAATTPIAPVMVAQITPMRTQRMNAGYCEIRSNHVNFLSFFTPKMRRNEIDVSNSAYSRAR